MTTPAAPPVHDVDADALSMKGDAWTRDALTPEVLRRMAIIDARGQSIDVMGLALDVLGLFLVPEADDRIRLAKQFRDALVEVLDEVENITPLVIPQAQTPPFEKITLT